MKKYSFDFKTLFLNETMESMMSASTSRFLKKNYFNDTELLFTENKIWFVLKKRFAALGTLVRTCLRPN